MINFKHTLFGTIAALTLLVIGTTSCNKQETSTSVLGTYWEGSTTVISSSGTGGMQLTYTIQMLFSTNDKCICQATLGPTRDAYYVNYSMKDSKNILFTVYTSDTESHQETGVLSDDGNTFVYHTKVFSDDESSWTDITMTKKPRPTE